MGGKFKNVLKNTKQKYLSKTNANAFDIKNSSEKSFR
jgi:hypothetical protein